jgi:SAM-dependent methyltransferase
MDKSSRIDIPLDEQRHAWNKWNAAARETRISSSSERQAQLTEQWIAASGSASLRIIDVGCGAGWTCNRLAKYGSVTGIDLADEVIERARARYRHIQFVSGDLFSLPLPISSFDVAVSLEVLSHVADQSAFIARLATILKPGGMLILATQNRPVLERCAEIGGPIPGQIRRWVDAGQLRRLLAPHFGDLTMTSLMPVGNQGSLRILNSPKLNRLINIVVPADRVERAKERALLGRTLMVRAIRQAPWGSATSDSTAGPH